MECEATTRDVFAAEATLPLFYRLRFRRCLNTNKHIQGFYLVLLDVLIERSYYLKLIPASDS